MHIQKLLAMISVGAIFSAVSLQAQSADNDFQAKAREALRQKMAELNQKPASTNKPVPVPPQPMTPVTPAAPVVTVPPVAPAAPVVTPPPQSTSAEQQAKALEALRQKQAELDAQQPPAAATAPVVPVAPVTPPVAPTAPAVPPPVAVVTPPPQTASPELQAQALEALRQKKAELDAQDQTVAVKTPPTQIKPAAAPAPMTMPVTKSTPASAPVFPTASPAPQYPAVPTMLSGSKEQRLAELLQLYKSDKITPADYHQQRAKILAEP